VDNRENVIGEARYVRVAKPSFAEVSMAVADPWQGNGLGKMMLTKLQCRAAADGICRLIAETLAANERLLSLARHMGFSESCPVRGVIRLEKTLIHDHAGSQSYLTA
jgi:L-amino acid N-acyltransferase YncA